MGFLASRLGFGEMWSVTEFWGLVQRCILVL